MKPIFFASSAELRKWFEKNHLRETEVYIGFHKTKTKRPSITWSQSVNEALCFGWIDGMRKSIDEERYFIRFTPRKTNSIWSKINIKKIDELMKSGLMKPAGVEAFTKRTESKSRIYSYENKAVPLSEKFEKKLKSNRKAWAFFISQA